MTAAKKEGDFVTIHNGKTFFAKPIVTTSVDRGKRSLVLVRDWSASLSPSPLLQAL